MGAMLGGMSLLLVRRLATTESVIATMTYFALTTVVLSVMTSPFGWMEPSGTDAALLAMLGSTGAVGHYCLVQSMARASVVETAPLEYVNMIWALGFGLVLFNEIPSARELLGSAMVVGAAWVARPKRRPVAVSVKETLEQSGRVD